MKLSYPADKVIDKCKYDDLIQLLKYVPKEHHTYFVNLKTDENEIDQGLADISSDDED